MRERIDQRVLGALRLVDRVTQVPVQQPMTVFSNRARLTRNRSGLYVIAGANGLKSHLGAFAQPPLAPLLQSIEVAFQISDPKGRYLARRLNVRLPRDPDPAHADATASLFHPIEVALYPASTASISTNWCSIRVSLTRNGKPAPAALLRVVDEAEDRVLASGISDQRGEALVIVPGVPITKFADDEDEGPGHGHGDDEEPPVMVTTLQVRLEVSLVAGSTWPVDPDVLERDHAANLLQSVALTLKTGRMEKMAINLT